MTRVIVTGGLMAASAAAAVLVLYTIRQYERPADERLEPCPKKLQARPVRYGDTYRTEAHWWCHADKDGKWDCKLQDVHPPSCMCGDEPCACPWSTGSYPYFWTGYTEENGVLLFRSEP